MALTLIRTPALTYTHTGVSGVHSNFSLESSSATVAAGQEPSTPSLPSSILVDITSQYGFVSFEQTTGGLTLRCVCLRCVALRVCLCLCVCVCVSCRASLLILRHLLQSDKCGESFLHVPFREATGQQYHRRCIWSSEWDVLEIEFLSADGTLDPSLFIYARDPSGGAPLRYKGQLYVTS